jgi:hypothetical protein
MSAVADFTLLPRAVLPQLAEMASAPGWQNFLETKGKYLADFNWPGWVFDPLLAYLAREINMDREKFEFAGLSEELSRRRGRLCEIFGAQEKKQFLAQLNPRAFAPEVLGSFANSVNNASMPDAGEAMLAGIHALQSALSQVGEGDALLLSIN